MTHRRSSLCSSVWCCTPGSTGTADCSAPLTLLELRGRQCTGRYQWCTAAGPWLVQNHTLCCCGPLWSIQETAVQCWRQRTTDNDCCSDSLCKNSRSKFERGPHGPWPSTGRSMTAPHQEPNQLPQFAVHCCRLVVPGCMWRGGHRCQANPGLESAANRRTPQLPELAQRRSCFQGCRCTCGIAQWLKCSPTLRSQECPGICCSTAAEPPHRQCWSQDI